VDAGRCVICGPNSVVATKSLRGRAGGRRPAVAAGGPLQLDVRSIFLVCDRSRMLRAARGGAWRTCPGGCWGAWAPHGPQWDSTAGRAGGRQGHQASLTASGANWPLNNPSGGRDRGTAPSSPHLPAAPPPTRVRSRGHPPVTRDDAIAVPSVVLPQSATQVTCGAVAPRRNSYNRLVPVAFSGELSAERGSHSYLPVPGCARR